MNMKIKQPHLAASARVVPSVVKTAKAPAAAAGGLFEKLKWQQSLWIKACSKFN